jgi:hypothetical protein
MFTVDTTKQPAWVIKVSDGYYVLHFSDKPSDSDIGGTNKVALERWARKQGYRVIKVDGIQ